MPLPLPPHFDPDTVGTVYRVDYAGLAAAAPAWATAHALRPAHTDTFRMALLAVDVQNTFCVPGFELFVGGHSGQAAVDDTRRLCRFIYRHLGRLTHILPTLDTHAALQIFHPLFLVDADGRPPAPFTVVTAEDVAAGRWRFNEALAGDLGLAAGAGQRHLEHYTRTLARRGKYALTVWPYHAMLGGIGHALVSAFEAAVFFHTVVRQRPPLLHVKGTHPLTEHYSALGPEVTTRPDGTPLTPPDDAGARGLLDALATYDAVLIAGQAKSHCVAWTIDDLLGGLQARDARLAERIYLLEDCTSPIVVPGGPDFTDAADAAFARFADAGMHRVRSTVPLADWPGVIGQSVAAG